MTDELAVFEDFIPNLDYHEANVFRRFLEIVAHLIDCHPNDQSGPCNMAELAEQVKRQEEIEREWNESHDQKFSPKNDEEQIRYALMLSPLITHVGYSRVRRTDCNEYQYGIVFAIRVKLYRDTTGLCDAIEHHANFAIKYEFNEKTRYTSKITVYEEPEERFDMHYLKDKRVHLPVAISVMDKVVERLREEYMKKREMEELTEG